MGPAMSEFKIGQDVICINDNFKWARARFRNANIIYPVFGKIYTVRRYTIEGTHPTLVLFEIHNPYVIYLDQVIREAGFWEKRFVGRFDSSLKQKEPKPEYAEIHLWDGAAGLGN